MRERIHALDVIRALALLGVLEINLTMFAGDFHREFFGGVQVPAGWAGAFLVSLRERLIAGKAMALFSMLFGVGLGIQLARARARQASFSVFAARRILFLALLGAAHLALVWVGDILLVYAVVAVLLLPFLSRAPRTLVIATLSATALSALWPWLHGALGLPEQIRLASYLPRGPRILSHADLVYGAGSFWAVARLRLEEWGDWMLAIAVREVTYALPFFLAGLAFWRSGLFARDGWRPERVRRWFHATFWPGLVLNLVPSERWLELSARLSAPWGPIVRGLTFQVIPMLLAVGYLMGLVRLLARPGRLAQLAPLGRMALTNYLVQSLICTWVFNGYGLGLWQQVTPSTYLSLGCALYAAQAAGSAWWLSRFRFGPVEWLWRCASYGRWQPWRR